MYINHSIYITIYFCIYLGLTPLRMSSFCVCARVPFVYETSVTCVLSRPVTILSGAGHPLGKTRYSECTRILVCAIYGTRFTCLHSTPQRDLSSSKHRSSRTFLCVCVCVCVCVRLCVFGVGGFVIVVCVYVTCADGSPVAKMPFCPFHITTLCALSQYAATRMVKFQPPLIEG